MESPKRYVIGTRDSLLAVTQTEQVRAELEKKTGYKFDLKTMKTEGDLKIDRPLWQIPGKNFFTKELDVALLNGEVDLTISSYKDLGSDRPEGVVLAAVTERMYSNDILLIKKNRVKELQNCKHFMIGTSSPRRIYHIEKSITSMLPVKATCEVKTEVLRGNVNTRISKLLNDQYDAIVLAFAGLERLAKSEESAKILKELLKDLTFIILPQSLFPSAPAQGVLGIECRKADHELQTILKAVHHEQSWQEVSVEREHFKKFGGGCHLAMGIYAKDLRGGKFLSMKGIHGAEEIKQIGFDHKRPDSKGERVFVGISQTSDSIALTDACSSKERLKLRGLGKHLLISSPFCIDSLSRDFEGALWSSGIKTHKELVSQGHFVNGSCDSFGEELIESYLSSKALQMMLPPDELKVLTGEGNRSKFKTISCYSKKTLPPTADYRKEIEQIEVFYWGSAFQYTNYAKEFPNVTKGGNIHCCGLGKTFDHLVELGVSPIPFFSIQEFLTWFKNCK